MSAVCLVACAMQASGAPAADTLFLKDNTTRIGRIMAQDSAYTTIRTEHDLLVIAAPEILRVGRERVRDILLPQFSIYVNGGVSVPSQFDFPQSFGLRAGGRVMLSRMVGIGIAISYAAWQINFDTIKAGGNIKDNHPPITETFQVVATSPRLGVFLATPTGPNTRLLLGVDFGQTSFWATSQDTASETQSGFSYAVRADMRWGLTDNFAVSLGAQFEGFSTTFIALEQHDIALGVRHRVGDLLLAAGAEIGF